MERFSAIRILIKLSVATQSQFDFKLGLNPKGMYIFQPIAGRLGETLIIPWTKLKYIKTWPAFLYFLFHSCLLKGKVQALRACGEGRLGGVDTAHCRCDTCLGFSLYFRGVYDLLIREIQVSTRMFPRVCSPNPSTYWVKCNDKSYKDIMSLHLSFILPLSPDMSTSSPPYLL